MEETTTQILEAVCKAAGITVSEMRSRSRNPRLVAARYIAATLLSKEPYSLTQEEVASIICRDRSTVSYGVSMHTSHVFGWGLYRRIFMDTLVPYVYGVEKSLITPPIALITIPHFCTG